MIKKRNLDPSLLNWIMNVTGLGPGIGEIKYLVPAASATSQFRTQLQSMGVGEGDMFTSLATAYAALTGYRNDILLVMPGLYTETVTCDWAKSNTHMIGLGGPNVLGRVLRPNCMIYTDTASLDYVIHLTGNGCQFHNITLQSGQTGGSANATTLSAMGIAGYNNYFKRVSFRGIHSAAQLGAAACSSLEIMKGAGELLFEDCSIGQNGWGGQRTSTTQGHLLFTADSTIPSPQNGVFKNCLFLNRTVTAGCPMVYVSTLWGADRLWLFENCYFENWTEGTELTLSTEVFKELLNAQGYHIRFKNCAASGYTYWTTNTYGNVSTLTYKVMADMPITGTGGGLMRLCNGAQAA